MVGYLSRFLLLIRVGTRLKGESLIELEFGMLVFKEMGKEEYPEQNLSSQGREPTTN